MSEENNINFFQSGWERERKRERERKGEGETWQANKNNVIQYYCMIYFIKIIVRIWK